jgi:queuine tRNA-ribosyltransferase
MKKPVDTSCACYTCRTFSASYLHHLFNARELLAYRLATVHNLTFISNLMNRIRESIAAGSFKTLSREFLAQYQTTDEQVRVDQKQKWLQARQDGS